jgi:hypothetical protein
MQRKLNVTSGEASFFTIIGALVVFLTFVIKDAVKEQVKDKVGALDATENVFVLRVENVRLEDKVGRTESMVNRIWDSTNQKYLDYLKKVHGAMHFVQLTNLEEQFEETEGILDNLKRFVEKLPPQET